MFDVKHLVIKNVFNKPLRNVRRDKCLADRDRVIDSIMVTQNAACPSLRPGNRWRRNLAVKVPPVQARKHPVEIVFASLRRRQPLSAATTASDIGGPLHVWLQRIVSIRSLMHLRSSLRQQPCYQNKS